MLEINHYKRIEKDIEQINLYLESRYGDRYFSIEQKDSSDTDNILIYDYNYMSIVERTSIGKIKEWARRHKINVLIKKQNGNGIRNR